MKTLPIFRSHYSKGSSILTAELPDKAKKNAPQSIFSLAKEYKIDPIFVCDKTIIGFPKLHAVSQKLGVELRFGIKMTVTSDISLKNEESLKNDHDIIIWIMNSINIINGRR